MSDNPAQPTRSGPTRKQRKSRGRGLRAATGCITCRRRRVKCDEVHPQCGPCSKGHRDCVYHNDLAEPRSDVQPQGNVAAPFEHTTSESDSQIAHEPLQALADVCYDAQSTGQTPAEAPFISHASPIIARIQEPPLADRSFEVPQSLAASPAQYLEYGVSPGTDASNISIREPLSWFELLVADAANADSQFYLSPAQRLGPESDSTSPALSQPQLLLPRNMREKESFEAAAFQDQPNHTLIQRGFAPSAERPDSALPDEQSSWSLPEPVQLAEQELAIFKHFVLNLSSWLDLFDPLTHFATVVPRLAMRNTGLMKALLALSARHLSLRSPQSRVAPNIGDTPSLRDENHPPIGVDPSHPEISRNTSVQYYYETLHYLQKAMHYQSYTRSLELLATTLLISTYEMIDGSNQGWERHLKGVFWIQRSQDNHGESGGLRQAVWWAWLRQDLFAAFRERRRVFSFWRARKPLSGLNSYEMASRAIFLLSQAVNYCSKEESDVQDIQARISRGNEILRFLHEWRQYLPPEFEPLPETAPDGIYPPIWVHPPSFASALQMYNFAKILVVLHRPSVGGLYDFRHNQKVINESVGMICGLSRTIGEHDTASSVISSQCLFGAGLSVHNPHERAALLELLIECERRTGWPIKPLRDDLELEWRV